MTAPLTRPAITAAFAPTGGAQPRFPAFEATDLNGTVHQIPLGLSGPWRIIHIAYLREQQYELNAWLEHTLPLEAQIKGVRVYEFPVVKRGSVFFRAWLDWVMQRGIPHASARARTITLYTDVGAFQRAMGVAGSGLTHTLVLDPAGRIAWRADGPATPLAVRALRAFIAQAMTTARGDDKPATATAAPLP